MASGAARGTYYCATQYQQQRPYQLRRPSHRHLQPRHRRRWQHAPHQFCRPAGCDSVQTFRGRVRAPGGGGGGMSTMAWQEKAGARPTTTRFETRVAFEALAQALGIAARPQRVPSVLWAPGAPPTPAPIPPPAARGHQRGRIKSAARAPAWADLLRTASGGHVGRRGQLHGHRLHQQRGGVRRVTHDQRRLWHVGSSVDRILRQLDSHPSVATTSAQSPRTSGDRTRPVPPSIVLVRAPACAPVR